MSVIGSNALAGASGAGAGAGYQIDRSLRFNSADSAYLNRTPSSAGNRKTWTLSFWVKRAKLATSVNGIFSVHNASITEDNYAIIQFNSDDTLNLTYAYASYKTTTRKFRDPSAWYHIVVAVDTTDSTASDRIEIYVNGVKETSFSATHDPDLNQDLAWNQAAIHRIGSEVNQLYSDCYFAEINFIDGQALAPTDFGEYDANNVWQPKEFTGTYGTNGFHLDFSDNSSNAALGKNSAVADDFTYTVGALTTTQAADFYSAGSNPANNLFDGSTSTIVYGGYNSSSTNSDLIWTPNGAYSVSSSLRVYCGYYSTIYVNGVSKATGGQSSVPAWVTLSHTGSITSIKFENTSNANVIRAAAIEIDGTIVETTAWTVNNLTAENPTTLPGVDFDGSGDHVESADHADYSLGTNDFTIEFYVLPREFVNYDALVMKYAGNASNSSWWMSANSSGHILFYLYYSSSEMGITTSGTGMNLNKWNHVACVRDGSTARVYINGVQVGTGSISTNSVNDSATALRIGEDSQGSYDLDGIMSNVRLINGTCLYPSGTTFTVPSTPLTNVTNTKLLCCQSSSSATAATVSPNTLTTSGDPYAVERSDSTSADDSLIDTPTNYEADSGNNGGNYATLNPLHNGQTLSNGNLDVTGGSSWQRSVSTIAMSSGKWYWEYKITASNEHIVGIGPLDMQLSGNLGAGSPPGSGYLTETGGVNGTGANGSWSSTGGSTTGDLIGMAFDADAGNMYIYKNGTALNSGIASHTGLTNGPYYAVFSLNGSSRSGSVNFGQRPFAYTPPTGYKSLCTANLPDPTIADGSTAFDTKTYTGTGNALNITGLNFSPDLVWIKNRSSGYSHCLYDTVRGVGKRLASDGTYGEDTYNLLTNFNAYGFSLGSGFVQNASGVTSVAWTWDGGTSNTSISAGSLNSSAYDQSQTWSSTGTNTNTSSIANAFNGNLTNYWLSDESTTSRYTFASVLTGTKFELYMGVSLASNNFSVNGQTSSAVSGALSDQWVDVTDAVTASNLNGLSYIDISYSAGNYSQYIYGIKVDGKLLVDSGVSVTNVPSIASTVRAAPTAGFSIVSYTGSGSVATVGHGLNAAPEFIITKARSNSTNWVTGHTGAGWGNFLFLDTTDAAGSSAAVWNSTAPDSNVFSLASSSYINPSGSDVIAYCFAPVDQYSSFGSFQGNGSADGPFVFTGFRPRWLMVKSSSNSGEHWLILDTERDPHNLSDATIYANLANAEAEASALGIDILSNGFKPRGTNAGTNASGYTYIYAAFAEHPFKTARAR